MALPSLRQPAAASVLAGVFGAGVVDALLTARGGAAGSVVLLALGLYGTAALVAAGGAALVMAGLRGAWPPGWGSLADDAQRDRAVAAGILAGCVAVGVIAIVVAAGQLVLVGNMSSQKLATIASAGLVAAGALPAAIAAITALPVLRRLAALLPRLRGVGATGFLLLALAAGGALAFVAALSRADWRVLNLGPLYSLVVAIVLGGAHALFWYGLPAGRALRARLPAAAGLALPAAIAVAAVIALVTGSRLPEGAPVFGAVADNSWGLRSLLTAARKATDGDRDGFSARFGGGDCDDRRDDVHPGAEDFPGDGVDANCEGGDAKVGGGADTAGSAGTATAKVTPRENAFKGNLLIVTIDALRADRLGIAGYSRPEGKSLTPTLDRLARRGAYFSRAWSHAPNTPRSFPSILTGRYPSDIAWDKPGVNYPNLLPSNVTFFQTLAAAGWMPIGIFSHFYFTADRGISRGFTEWSNDGAGTIAESNKDIASPRIVPRVIERLKKAAASKQRFVMWTHLFEPHSSYMTHKEFPTSLSGVQGLMEKYDFEIAYTDIWLGKLLDAVKEAGLADNTAIVIMADHGEAWGEHKHYFHGQDLFDEQLRVPLIIDVPGQGSRRIDDAVSLVDVGPTLLDLVGAPIPANMRGRSLMPYIEGQGTPPGARPIFAELMPATAWPHHAAMMVDGNHKLIHRISDRRWELYDLKADAGEKKNLADAPAAAATFEAMRAKLVAFEERPR
jgi:arylsulfatase A-like enzyme